MDKILLLCLFLLTAALVSAQENPDPLTDERGEPAEKIADRTPETANDELYYFQRIPPINPVNLMGVWEKTFSMEEGREKRDPQWTLRLVFQDDGQFFYNNTFIEEVTFLNKVGEKTTRPIPQAVALKGTYKIIQNSLYLDFNTQSAADIEALGLSLGFHPNSRQVVIQLDQQREFLVFQAVNSPKKIFLTKTY